MIRFSSWSPSDAVREQEQRKLSSAEVPPGVKCTRHPPSWHQAELAREREAHRREGEQLPETDLIACYVASVSLSALWLTHLVIFFPKCTFCCICPLMPSICSRAFSTHHTCFSNLPSRTRSVLRGPPGMPSLFFPPLCQFNRLLHISLKRI